MPGDAGQDEVFLSMLANTSEASFSGRARSRIPFHVPNRMDVSWTSINLLAETNISRLSKTDGNISKIV